MFLSKQKNLGASLLLAGVLPFVCYFIPSYISAYALSPFVALCVFLVSLLFLNLLQVNVRNIAVFGTSAIYGCALVAFAFMRFNVDKCPKDNMPTGYNTGNTVEKIIGETLAPNGQIYYANQGLVAVTNCGTVYLDHDSCTVYGGGNFTQKSPWHKNSLIAAEPFRVNMAQDGCLVMNFGSRIAWGKPRPIWGMCDSGGFSMLCAYDGNRLIFGDADMAGDMLSPYQEHIWRHLSGKDVTYRVWLVAAGIVLILFVVLERFVTVASFLVVALSLLLNASLLLPPHEGGVRYVGYNIGYPHTSLCYGLVRAMHKAGINVLFTRSKARILAIGAGHAAARQAEQIIILEPDAKVVIGGKVYVAGCVPMGEVEGVVDAREILEECGRAIGSAKIEVDGVRIVATGSPSLLDTKILQ